MVGFGAAAHHVALYVMFGEALRTMKAELARFAAEATDFERHVPKYSPGSRFSARILTVDVLFECR